MRLTQQMVRRWPTRVTMGTATPGQIGYRATGKYQAAAMGVRGLPENYGFKIAYLKRVMAEMPEGLEIDGVSGDEVSVRNVHAGGVFRARLKAHPVKPEWSEYGYRGWPVLIAVVG